MTQFYGTTDNSNSKCPRGTFVPSALCLHVTYTTILYRNHHLSVYYGSCMCTSAQLIKTWRWILFPKTCAEAARVGSGFINIRPTFSDSKGCAQAKFIRWLLCSFGRVKLSVPCVCEGAHVCILSEVDSSLAEVTFRPSVQEMKQGKRRGITTLAHNWEGCELVCVQKGVCACVWVRMIVSVLSSLYVGTEGHFL